MLDVHTTVSVMKSGQPYKKNLISPEKKTKHILLEYRAPWRGASNEYPQYIFSLRNKNYISIFG